MAEQENAIICQDLTFHYHNRPIFSQFNLKIPFHKMNLIKGKNGIGKTTLLKLMASILLPPKGSVHYRGIVNPKINWLPSCGNALFPHLTGIENFTLFQHLTPHQCLTIDEIKTLLVNYPVMIETLNKSLPVQVNQCSDGMKQLIKIAIALSHNAHFYFWDEPFQNLSQELALELSLLMNTFFQEKTLVLTDHRHSGNNDYDEINLETLL